jgi:hypothetical protein
VCLYNNQVIPVWLAEAPADQDFLGSREARFRGDFGMGFGEVYHCSVPVNRGIPPKGRDSGAALLLWRTGGTEM